MVLSKGRNGLKAMECKWREFPEFPRKPYLLTEDYWSVGDL